MPCINANFDRNAGLQTGFDQFSLGLRVVAAAAILLAAHDQPLLQFCNLLCHRCPPSLYVDTSFTTNG